jgi:ABC-2 type transport system permease protein
MNKTWFVLKNEVIRIVSRKSFILTLVLIPLVSFLVIWGIGKIRGTQTENAIANMFFDNSNQSKLEGYIDYSGLLDNAEASLKERFSHYDDEESARVDLEAGKIAAYYVITAGYVETGKVFYYRPDFNPLAAFEEASDLRKALQNSLVNGDETLTERLSKPMVLERKYLKPQNLRDEDNLMTFFLPYGVTLLFYMIVMTSSSMMLSSVSDEKQNRVMEILMSSVKPIQLLTGKIIALGLIGLLQSLVWGGAGLLLLRLSGQTFNLPENLQLPPQMLAWFVVFFVLGYAIYASLLGGLGALVPNIKEASQVTFILLAPLIVPLMMIGVLINRPNSLPSVILSLFPLSSPMAMMTRLATTDVPGWQVGLALVLLAATSVLTVRASAGMFRAQNLIAGQKADIKTFFLALIGKA